MVAHFIKESGQRLVWTHNGKRAGSVASLCQFEHQIVTADEHIGIASQGELQKHLIIRIPTFWQLGCALWNGISGQRHMLTISIEQLLPSRCIKSELGVADDARQFGQCAVVGQARHLARFNGCAERCQRRRLKVKQIHHHIGIQNQSRDDRA